MIAVERAAVIGLGLVGGSVARELSAAGVRVDGYDVNEHELEAARREGVIASTLSPSFAGVEDVEVIVLAVPVDSAIEVLIRVADRSPRARLITDVGSTKAEIVKAASQAGLGTRFVGAHPMAGDHRSGWAASRLGLFSGATVYLCACPETTDEASELASALWQSLGARVAPICGDEHDRRLAWMSHMPHMTSIALATVLDDAGIARAELGPGGRDLTRLAGSSVSMWAAVARENHAALVEAMAALEQRVAGLRAAIASGDAERLATTLARARVWFDATGAAVDVRRT